MTSIVAAQEPSLLHGTPYLQSYRLTRGQLLANAKGLTAADQVRADPVERRAGNAEGA